MNAQYNTFKKTRNDCLTESWTFVKMRLKGYENKGFQWALQISTIQELMDYDILINKGRLRMAFIDRVKTKKMEHFTNRLTIVSDIVANCKEVSFVDALTLITMRALDNQFKVLNNGEILYINRNGGYFSINPENDNPWEILETIKSNKIKFPEESVRFLQWPNGAHWYAKYGDLDIVWQGKQKWDTRKEAEEAAKEWKDHN